MTDASQVTAGMALRPVIHQILEDIAKTSGPDVTTSAQTLDARYKDYQAQARALSLMIKAEADLIQRDHDLSQAAQKETLIAYEDLPPLNAEGLELLEKRFAHLAYQTEIEGLLPALPCKS